MVVRGIFGCGGVQETMEEEIRDRFSYQGTRALKKGEE